MRVDANLVPRSLVDEAEGEIRLNPICVRDRPVRNVTGDERAHARNKSSILDMLKN